MEDNELCILPHSNPPAAREAFRCAVPDLDINLEWDIAESKRAEDESGSVLKNSVQQAWNWLTSIAHGSREVWIIELKEETNKLCNRLGEPFLCCIKFEDDK